MYHEYQENMDTLLANHHEFGRPISNTVFAVASFDFSPNAISFEHTDSGNKANGPCPIFCSGKFNPRKGGHLVLRQLKLVVEFPAGCIAVIPSAVLKHGNTSIQAGECRESFTQYAAGGLFRWVQYGFRSWKSLAADEDRLAEELNRREVHWVQALEKFSTVSSLHTDRMHLFGV